MRRASQIREARAGFLHHDSGTGLEEASSKREEPQVSVIEKTVEIAVPRRMAYDQWTQFEDFPRFMRGVEHVEQVDDSRVHWTAEIAGVRREWDTEIVEQEPDTLVAWCATDGVLNDGVVSFSSLGPETTRVSVRMDFEPAGFTEKAADVLHLIDRRVGKDLEGFKTFIEGRTSPTGAWRRTIRGTGNLGPDRGLI
jgi:uncharacterized membrane protein